MLISRDRGTSLRRRAPPVKQKFALALQPQRAPVSRIMNGTACLRCSASVFVGLPKRV
jgi:hypothetical protein